MRTAFLVLALTSILTAQQYYFYHPEIDYGSEANFNPGTVILNGVFDILRNGGHSKDIFVQPYGTGLRNVLNNISHPIQSINNYGWENFLKKEVVPFSLNKDRAQYVPNYLHHLLGAGMIYQKLAEWYDFHGVPYPHLSSVFTSFLYHLFNEALENRRWLGTNTDPIADLLIFDPLGILLFNSKTVQRFFSKKVILQDWSLQPVFNPYTHHLDNAGQQFVLKYPYSRKWAIFAYWGIQGLIGFSYSSGKDAHYSFGIGQVVNKLNPRLNRKSIFMTPHVDGAMGIFYDRNNSLLASVILTGPGLWNLRMNIFPGLLSIGKVRPGIYLGVGEWDQFIFGIKLAKIPLGASVGGKY